MRGPCPWHQRVFSGIGINLELPCDYASATERRGSSWNFHGEQLDWGELLVRTAFHALVLLAAFLMSLPFSSTAMALGETAKQPNFIVIVIDDMGYSDVGTYGCKDIPTPHIDSAGPPWRAFTNSDSTCAVCSPARAAILTGRYQERYGLDWVMIEPYGVDVHEKTLADLLKKQGYVKRCDRQMAPGPSRGLSAAKAGIRLVLRFSRRRPFPSAADAGRPGPSHGNVSPLGPACPRELMVPGERKNIYPPPLYRNDKETPHEGYLTEVFTREAVQFIDKNKDRPFFLYLARGPAHSGRGHPEVSAPLPFARRPRGTTLVCRRAGAVDDGVGEILAELRKHDLEKNTVIVFTSDNGGAASGSRGRRFWTPCEPACRSSISSRARLRMFARSPDSSSGTWGPTARTTGRCRSAKAFSTTAA